MSAPNILKIIPHLSAQSKLNLGVIDLSKTPGKNDYKPLSGVDFEPEVLDHSTFNMATQHWNIMDNAKVIVKPVVGPNATIKYHLILTDQHGKVTDYASLI